MNLKNIVMCGLLQLMLLCFPVACRSYVASCAAIQKKRLNRLDSSMISAAKVLSIYAFCTSLQQPQPLPKCLAASTVMLAACLVE